MAEDNNQREAYDDDDDLLREELMEVVDMFHLLVNAQDTVVEGIQMQVVAGKNYRVLEPCVADLDGRKRCALFSHTLLRGAVHALPDVADLVLSIQEVRTCSC